MDKKPKKTTGRPKKYNIEPKDVEKLASYGMTNVEIADFFGCSKQLITTTYCTSVTKGKANTIMRLRKAQIDTACAGNVAMLIWLGKQMLGQADKQEVTTTELPEGFNIEVI